MNPTLFAVARLRAFLALSWRGFPSACTGLLLNNSSDVAPVGSGLSHSASLSANSERSSEGVGKIFCSGSEIQNSGLSMVLWGSQMALHAGFVVRVVVLQVPGKAAKEFAFWY